VGSDEWHEIEGTGEPLPEMLISDVGLLDEFAHSMRMRLLMLLREPATVAELAALLDVPTTRLYHHVAHLESIGFVQVVATRKVRSVTEKRFRATALGYRIDPAVVSALDARAVQRVIGSMFDITKAELVRAMDGGLDLTSPAEAPIALRLEHLRLTPERQRELVSRLVAVIEEFEDEDDDAAFVVLLAAFPSDTPPPSNDPAHHQPRTRQARPQE
jgi:hypothetical protein